eukprot:jgi/Galph1/3462/GphlegSOOS_G2163.1
MQIASFEDSLNSSACLPLESTPHEQMDQVEPPSFEGSAKSLSKFQTRLEESIFLKKHWSTEGTNAEKEDNLFKRNSLLRVHKVFHQLSLTDKVNNFEQDLSMKNVQTNVDNHCTSVMEFAVQLLSGVNIFWRYKSLWKKRAKLFLREDLKSLLIRTCTTEKHIEEFYIEDVTHTERIRSGVKLSTMNRCKMSLFLADEQASAAFFALLQRLLSNVNENNQKDFDEKTFSSSKSEWLMDRWKHKFVHQKRILNKDVILLKTIGHGSFGKVKLGFSFQQNSFVAVKVIFKSKLCSSYETERSVTKLLTECKVMLNLRHPHILKLYAIYDDPKLNCFYLVMEYASKGAIMRAQQHKRVTPLKEEDLRNIISQVLEAMCYLHGQGIAHNDLKPDNILLTNNDIVKIADFGESEKFDKQDETKDWPVRLQGTPAFCAPELCLTCDNCPSTCFEYRFAPDVWSLGATTFFLAIGKVPFQGQNIFEMYESICTKPLVFPSEPVLSSHLQSFISQAMSKNPMQRPSMQQLKRHPWLRKVPF